MNPLAIKAIVLTHLHLDHFAGLYSVTVELYCSNIHCSNKNI
ncbi:MAG: MBL fold metallo-hydrolase [Candidatus Hodarchaeales archaeon]